MPTNLPTDTPMIERPDRSRRAYRPAVALIALLAVMLLVVGTLRIVPSRIGDAGTIESANALIGP